MRQLKKNVRSIVEASVVWPLGIFIVSPILVYYSSFSLNNGSTIKAVKAVEAFCDNGHNLACNNVTSATAHDTALFYGWLKDDSAYNTTGYLPENIQKIPTLGLIKKWTGVISIVLYCCFILSIIRLSVCCGPRGAVDPVSIMLRMSIIMFANSSLSFGTNAEIVSYIAENICSNFRKTLEMDELICPNLQRDTSSEVRSSFQEFARSLPHYGFSIMQMASNLFPQFMGCITVIIIWVTEPLVSEAGATAPLVSVAGATEPGYGTFSRSVNAEQRRTTENAEHRQTTENAEHMQTTAF